MTLYAPFYYTEFACIAEKCQHSCCIGWEIDIDEDTLEYYNTVDGKLGKRLKQNIAAEDDPAHFVLGKDERCPFLNECGLCDIISELGDEALCQICDDHPRYRNYYSDRTEIGVGMCCEAAAQLILSQKEKFSIVCLETDETENLYPEEEELLGVREQLFELLTDRTLPLESRVNRVLEFCDIVMPDKSLAEWADIYLSLERLDDKWTEVLNELKNSRESRIVLPQNEEISIAFEQLLCYFVYRHLTDSLDDDRLWERIAFAVQSYRIIRSLCAVQYNRNDSLDVDDIAEICRMYSSEIEYSEDNMEKLLEIMI